MNRRILSVVLTVCASLAAPAAMASQPAGLAGELIIETNPPPNLICSDSPFEAYLYFGQQPLAPGDTLTVEIALVPFSAGVTWFTLDTVDGPTFMGLVFADGRVTFPTRGPAYGLPYNRSGWNALTVLVRPATQDFILTVNGAASGPIPFNESCADQGGCFSAQALRIDNGFPSAGGAVAWIDTLGIASDGPAGHQRLATRNFDRFGESAIVQTVGGVLIGQNPPRMNRNRR